MASTNKPIGANAHSPFAGCAILIAALAVMVFLLVFSTWGLFRQAREIEKFTAVAAQPVAVAAIEGEDVEINRLAEKLEKFRAELAGDDASKLALTPAELNLAIAVYEPFADLRGTLRVVAVDGPALRLAICFKLNGKPRWARPGEHGWIHSDPRFLNATLLARPELLGKEVVLKLETIEVTDAKVPVEFKEHMSPYRITERYLGDALLGPAMGKLTAVAVEDGCVVLRRQPGQVPGDRITAGQVDFASSRLFTVLGVVACGFLLFVGFLILVRARARSSTPPP
ncbi:MAG: hypothetical protein DVB25_04470 [Verrucomicrobia bacterium]|nr:MAG: hypothetical protein DVB25_04470 [Verrucomicrobiota bacterium]